MEKNNEYNNVDIMEKIDNTLKEKTNTTQDEKQNKDETSKQPIYLCKTCKKIMKHIQNNIYTCNNKNCKYYQIQIIPKKEQIQEPELIMNKEDAETIKQLEAELKKIKGDIHAKETIAHLKDQIKKAKRNGKPDTTITRGLKAYANSMKKFVDWWTMKNLTPQQRQAKKQKFEQATQNMFGNLGGGAGQNNQPPSLFGENYNNTPQNDFLGLFGNNTNGQNTQKQKRNTKKGGKSSKNIVSDDLIILNGEQYVHKTRKKTKKRKKQTENTENEQPKMFFDPLG